MPNGFGFVSGALEARSTEQLGPIFRPFGLSLLYILDSKPPK